LDIDLYGSNKKENKIPQGSITWASGELKRGKKMEGRWWYIPPPYDLSDAIPLAGPPNGARDANKHTPGETLQILGEAGGKVPHIIKKDLGWADINIIDGKDILFKGSGLKTDVGTRKPETTVGVTIEGNGTGNVDESVLEDMALKVSNKAIKRAAKKEKRTGKKKISEWDRITTMKGYKF
jgi:hypothetical protein